MTPALEVEVALLPNIGMHYWDPEPHTRISEAFQRSSQSRNKETQIRIDVKCGTETYFYGLEWTTETKHVTCRRCLRLIQDKAP